MVHLLLNQGVVKADFNDVQAAVAVVAVVATYVSTSIDRVHNQPI